MRRAAAALAALAIATPAAAADLAPGLAEIKAATAEGVAMLAGQQGYAVKDHVLYAVRDARGIDPADGSVDAIVVATPYERTRHAAFVAGYAARPIAPGEAYRQTGLAPGTLDILIYAHGSDGSDMAFAEKFGPARLLLGDREVPAAGSPRHSGPSQTLYPLAAEQRERFVATVTYRFDLSTVPDAGRQAGRLRFSDASGKAFDLPINLARFR